MTRLYDLDPTLKPEMFTSALRFGLAQGRQTLATEPLASRGYTTWSKTAGLGRTNLRQVGWEAIDHGNYALAINPSKTVGIVWSSGDSNTGIDDSSVPEPQCANPKGTAIRAAVEQNLAIQGQLGELEPSFPHIVDEEQSETATWTTWVFLYFENPETDEVRAELSLPSEMSGDQITGWQERIFIELSREPGDHPTSSYDDGEPIDVPVSRRAD